MTVQHVSLASTGTLGDDPQQRELVVEQLSSGSKRLSLMLRDEEYRFNKIPVGVSETLPGNEQADGWPTYLVPVTFLRSLPDLPEEASSLAPLRDGWLYIYVNGYLWRELEVFAEGEQFRDVQLTYAKGLDERRATGLPETVVVLPLRINGTACDVRIAYSDQQWSWTRINQLGGLDPDDPRQRHGDAKVSDLNPEFCEAQRAARLTCIDLSHAEENYAATPEDAAVRLVNPEQLIESRRHYNTQFDKGNASVVLPDWLGDARYYAESSRELTDMLNSTVAALTDYHSEQSAEMDLNTLADARLAMLLNQQLFAGVDAQLALPNLDDDTREVLEERVELRELVSVDDIEKALEKEGCFSLIEDALAYRISTEEHLAKPEVHAAIADYLIQPTSKICQLYDLVGSMIEGFNAPVALTYKDLYLNPDDYQRHCDQDIGIDLIKRLKGVHETKDAHPLCSYLFPEYDEENPLKVDERELKDDEIRIDPAKLKALFSDVDEEGIDRNDAQIARYMSHSINAFAERISDTAFEQVEQIQAVEQTSGEIDERRSDLTRESESLVITKQNEERKLFELNRKRARVVQLKMSYQTKHYINKQKLSQLIGEATIDEVNAFSQQKKLQIESLELEIQRLEADLIEADRDLFQARRQQAITNQGLVKIGERLEAMQASPNNLLSSARFNGNAPVVALYSLVAGDHLQAVSLTPDDVLNGRYPEGLVPFSGPGRIERLKKVVAVANEIRTSTSPRVQYNGPNGRTLQVPADLAVNRVEDLHLFLSHFQRRMLDDAVENADRRITQIFVSLESVTKKRSNAEIIHLDLESRLPSARKYEQAAASAMERARKLQNGSVELDGKIYATEAELRNTTALLTSAEETIESLGTQIDRLDASAHFDAFEKTKLRSLLLGTPCAALESFNLINSFSKLRSPNGRRVLDAIVSTADMMATISTFRKNHHSARYGTIKSIRTRLANPENYKYVKTYAVSPKVLQQAVSLNRIMIASNAISGVFGAGISLLDAFNRARLGDHDAAFGYGVMAAGFMATIFASSMVFGIVGFAVVALGFVLVWLFTDSKLETLLKNCQFGSAIEDRFGGDAGYFSNSSLGSGQSYGSWQRFRHYAYHEIASYFHSPNIVIEDTWLTQGEALEIDISTPQMTGSGTKEIKLYVKGYGSTWTELSTTALSTEYVNGNRALVSSSLSRHRIEVSRELVASGGTRSVGGMVPMGIESSVKVEVRYFPYGKDRTLFRGTAVIHYYPSPSRDEQGRAVIEGEVVSEERAQELSLISRTETIGKSILGN